MLEDYRQDQPIACKFIEKILNKNLNAHAYLIETNNYSKSLDLATAFAKSLLCLDNKINNSNCKNCNQCNMIDKGDFLEFKIIKAEGEWIKKSQLDELQLEFSKKSLIGNKKIYIIEEAEKLNTSSSNSILKFLEEPQDGVVAILLVKNKNQLLDTIISRCQIISLLKDKKENINADNTLSRISLFLFNNELDINNFVTDENSLKYVESVVNFVKTLEKSKEDALCFISEIWHSIFKERKYFLTGLEIMLLCYKDILNYKLGKEIEYFVDYMGIIKEISKKSDINKLIHKISLISDLKSKIKNNVNLNMLMDKLIINM